MDSSLNKGRGMSMDMQTEDIETEIEWGTKITMINHEGSELHIGYNAKYLENIVKSLVGDEIVVKYGSPVSATIFRGDDPNVTNLLMPVRLND